MATVLEYGEGYTSAPSYADYGEAYSSRPVAPSTDPELPQPQPTYQRPPTTNTPVPAPAATGTSSGTSAIGINYTIPTPVSYNNDGAPVYKPNDPAYYQSETAIREASRAALREAANAYGLTNEIITTVAANGRTYMDLPGGKQVDITDYFAGIPGGPVWQDVSVDRNTVGYETGYGGRTVQIEPPLEQSVTTQLPSGQNITIDPNSELARYIQWLGTQPNALTQVPIGAEWAARGVSDPYSDPATVQYAIDTLARAKEQQANREALGLPTSTPQWDDPNWPAYVGSNPDAFNEAVRAQNDPAYAAQLKAANGWDQNTYETWTRRILNPEEQNAIDAAYWASLGFVTGPSSNGSGTSQYGVSANGATVIENKIGVTTNQGFNTLNYSGVSTNGLVNSANAGLATATNAATNAANNLLNQAASVSSIALAGYASAQSAAAAAQNLISNAVKAPTALSETLSPFVKAATDTFAATASDLTNDLFGNQAATILLAKQQATIQSRYNQNTSNDWRVRLQLAPGADYLYKTGRDDGILGPLYDTDGVLFPYMPAIETSYAANYDKYDLTHSNYRGYFYKSSAVNDINIRATFTAQDTQEANYLLAVIHFFRSVTKMFYGQDSYRGAPPPLVFLSGLGNYQFNQHPCFVANFSYSLPNDVDYIRALAPNNYGNLFSQRARTGSTSGGVLGTVATRLLNAGLDAANPTEANVPSPSYITNNVNNLTGATYVPTKMEINITLLPTNTRAQVSQQFSLKDFANGNLIKGGFW